MMRSGGVEAILSDFFQCLTVNTGKRDFAIMMVMTVCCLRIPECNACISMCANRRRLLSKARSLQDKCSGGSKWQSNDCNSVMSCQSKDIRERVCCCMSSLVVAQLFASSSSGGWVKT